MWQVCRIDVSIVSTSFDVGAGVAGVFAPCAGASAGTCWRRQVAGVFASL